MIFLFFDSSKVLLLNSVCKWFRCIAYEDEFWIIIDLTSKPYSNPELLRFIRLFPRDCTEVLKISGMPDDSGRFPPFIEQLNSAIRISYHIVSIKSSRTLFKQM